MVATSLDWKSKREELKAKRKPLFTRYVKDPNELYQTEQLVAANIFKMGGRL